ncbi:PREDICTED: NXPE family member 3-like [Nanorana parkeri]|uniref:NXPE family member 3-like n=1 Tax=Nanorana parkeri TaxID=125878 RepID=UPI000854D1DC|nr:PREDICTED: NXPE family member 3-like [Nanorana parkeri]
MEEDKYRPPRIHQHHGTTSPTTSAPTVNPKFKELLQLIEWPAPPSTEKHFKFSTSPRKSEYHLWNPRDTYRVGETVQVVITARDHNGHLKGYGGDFFRVKLHNPALKAGVAGQVKDYNNGSYLATFLLPWPGEAQIHITLVHSSEAVDILKTKRENYPEKLYFNGYFNFNGSSEVVECNLEIKGKDVCKYQDPISGNTWQCVRPKNLPCHSWTHHSIGGLRKVTNALEDSLLSGPCTAGMESKRKNQQKKPFSLRRMLVEGRTKQSEREVIQGSVPPIKVMADNSSLGELPSPCHVPGFTLSFPFQQSLSPCHSFPETASPVTGLTSNLPPCRPGLESPRPTGFYYMNTWISLTCSVIHFSLPAQALACLKGKDIHMFGDSTLRQWFEYLEKFIPSLKRIDLHVTYLPGPLLAVEPNAGLALRYRAHGLPLKTGKTMVADLHYEAASLAGIGGGPQTIIVITLWAHFTTYPVMVYLERLERVRQAVESLLFRSPQTTVIVKSANTGSRTVDISDWLSLQLDILLRAVFKGMAVSIIDVWDMTSCHYLPNDIHPGQEVIKNEVDLLLSYICSQ